MNWNYFLEWEQLDELDEMILQLIRGFTHLVLSWNNDSLII